MRTATVSAALLVAAGCGGDGGPVGLSARAAHFDRQIAADGVTLHVTGHNCSGVYGRWSVDLEVRGAAKGSGSTEFTLSRGKAAKAPISLPIRAGLLSGRANGVLSVSPRGNALDVRGRIQVKVPLRTVSRSIHQRIALERGPTPACGLGAS